MPITPFILSPAAQEHMFSILGNIPPRISIIAPMLMIDKPLAAGS